jgi:hypothetical protein
VVSGHAASAAHRDGPHWCSRASYLANVQAILHSSRWRVEISRHCRGVINPRRRPQGVTMRRSAGIPFGMCQAVRESHAFLAHIAELNRKLILKMS